MARHELGRADEIAPGELKRFEVRGHPLCIAHLEGGGFHAVDDRCTHEDVDLSDGELLGTEIECPAHGSRFDVRTGAVCGLPATEPTRVYAVVVDGGRLHVDIP